MVFRQFFKRYFHCSRSYVDDIPSRRLVCYQIWHSCSQKWSIFKYARCIIHLQIYLQRFGKTYQLQNIFPPTSRVANDFHHCQALCLLDCLRERWGSNKRSHIHIISFQGSCKHGTFLYYDDLSLHFELLLVLGSRPFPQRNWVHWRGKKK